MLLWNTVGTYKASVIGASFAEVSGCYLLSFFSGHLFGTWNNVYPTEVEAVGIEAGIDGGIACAVGAGV